MNRKYNVFDVHNGDLKCDRCVLPEVGVGLVFDF